MTELPFSSPVAVRKLPARGTVVNYNAPDDVRAAIAADFDLISIDVFEAQARVSPWKKQGVQISGSICAELTQACAITGEPLSTTVREEIDALYVPEGSKLAQPVVDGEGEIVLDPEAADPPETFNGDIIELAQIWLEFLALGLDPFARQEGAQLPDTSNDLSGEDARTSPFAVLASLKKR